MTDREFEKRKAKVIRQCPRGKSHFCDGTPNPIPKGEYKSLGMCRFRKKGICTYLEEDLRKC